MRLALLQVWHHLPLLLPTAREGEGLAMLHLFSLNGETQGRRIVSNPRDGRTDFCLVGTELSMHLCLWGCSCDKTETHVLWAGGNYCLVSRETINQLQCLRNSLGICFQSLHPCLMASEQVAWDRVTIPWWSSAPTGCFKPGWAKLFHHWWLHWYLKHCSCGTIDLIKVCLALEGIYGSCDKFKLTKGPNK